MALRHDNALIDRSTQIRKGEELDIDQLKSYLSQYDDFGSEISIEQFPSGFSNLTYMIKSGEKEFVLRRPPFGANIKSAHDMGREYKVLSMLQPVYDKVPAPVLHCQDDSVIGAEFYIMERVKGIILRSKPPKNLSLTPELMENISKNAIDNLADLHMIDIKSSGLIELGKPEGYAKRQVEGWIGRYEKAKTDDIPAMEEVSQWLAANIPADNPPAMIHNDYKYDNMVLSAENPRDIVAVLDWEMATIGDPLMDLGTALAYWAEINDNAAIKTFNLTWLPGNLSRAEVLERYEKRTGADLKNIVFYYTYASFKLGVICQQIYARYKLGFTKDPRFAALIGVVQACGLNATKALENGHISD